MPTHDYIIANGTGAAVRADINAALSAIVSLNSSASEPGTMYAYQLWADTTSNLLKIRNSANSAWITLRQLDGDFSIVAVEDGLQATPSLTFTNDLNTGIFRPGNDSLSIVTNALRAITITSTQAVGIQTANPSTALHVAGNARVGADDTTDAHLQIGKGATGNRNSYIDIVGDTTYTDYGLRVIRNNGGADATSEIKHRGTGAFNIVTQEAAPIQFYTTNSPRLTITSGGNVGIGTSSPSGTLEVGAVSGTVTAGDLTVTTGSTTATVTIGRLSSTGSDNTIFNIRNRVGISALYMNSGDGKVGIGTTSPAGKCVVHVSNNTGAPTAWNSNFLLVSNGDTSTSSGIGFSVDGSDSSASISALTPGTNWLKQHYRANSHVFWYGDAGVTQAATIDTSGRLLVGTTTQVANVNGGILQLGSGITFPATAVAASDANTLDDYEEGTWTFAIATTTGSVTVSSTANNCWYIKIGALVTVGGNVTVGSVSSPTGAIIVTLPFAVTDLAESAEYNAGVVTIGTSVSKNTNDFALLAQGGAEMRIYIADVSLLSSGNANAQQLQANSIIHFQLSYYSA